MALSIPIITEYVGTGLDKFTKELAQAETKTQKAGLVMKKAFLPATAALGALAAAALDSAKAAMEDEAQQALLASQLRKTTNATDAQIKATEDYIGKQLSLKGFTDSQLRPAFEKLARATGDLTEAQKLTNTAMDIATATGKPLETVVASLEKAYGGNMAAIQRLLPEYRDMIKEGATFDEVMAKVNGTLGGAAAEAATTAEARFRILKEQMGEVQEEIGNAFIPILEKLLPLLSNLADWAQKNPESFLIVAGALAAIATSIMLINLAMALNPIGAIVIGVISLIAVLAIAYKQFDGFRKVVNLMINSTIANFENLANAFINTINLLIRGINLVNPGEDLKQLGEISLGRISGPGTAVGVGGLGGGLMNELKGVPAMAAGGIVTGPTLALIGEAGPEAVIPLDRMGSMGGGITVHVNAGLVSSPDQVGQQIIEAIQKAQRRSGPVFAPA
jgi:hypothetical protein